MAIPRVSDLQRFTGLAKKPFVLLGIAVLMLVACVLVGRDFSVRLDRDIASIPLAMGMGLIQVILLAFTGYLLGMAASVFAFGKLWRDDYLLTHTPEDPRDPEVYLVRVGDRTLPFWMMVLGATTLALLVLQAATDGYFLQFPNRAYPLVEFRSNSAVGQTRAMSTIVQRSLDRRIPGDSLRQRSAELLASDDAEVRGHAAWFVGRLHLVSLDAHLRPMLNDAEPSVREQAAIALGQLGVEQGVLSLELALETENDPDVRVALIVGMGLSRHAHAAKTLGDLLPSLSDQSRPYALWAIAEAEQLCLGDRVLRYAGTSYPVETRCAAMEAMKKLATPDQLEGLDAVFYGDDPWCPLRVWHGRSSNRVTRDFYRILVSGERLHEKAIDATFNVADPSLIDWLAAIVNNEDQAQLDRKHARRVYDLLDPAYPRAPRIAKGCEDFETMGESP